MYLNVSTYLRIIAIPFAIVWFVYAVPLGYSRGNPPSNSDGETCGFGNQTARPYLLFYDLARCAGLRPHVDICNTKKICVKECPGTYWQSDQGRPKDLKEFCEVMNLQKFKNTTLPRLIEQRFCPSYVLPSESYLGRCLLNSSMMNENKISSMKTGSGRPLHLEGLQQGERFIKDSIYNPGDVEKILGCFNYWWIVIITILTAFFFLSWKLLEPRTSRIVFLIATIVFSIPYYTLTIPGLGNYWWVLILFLIVFICGAACCAAFAKKSLETSYRNYCWILIQSLFFLYIALVVTGTLIVGMWLIKAQENGAPEYQVVNDCPQEDCFNEASERMFQRNDICEPNMFKECTACPRAECVHFKFRLSVEVSLLLMLNPVFMFWLLLVLPNLQRQPFQNPNDIY